MQAQLVKLNLLWDCWEGPSNASQYFFFLKNEKQRVKFNTLYRMEKGLAMLMEHRPKAPPGNRQDVPFNIPSAITTNAGGIQGEWTASHQQNSSYQNLV